MTPIALAKRRPVTTLMHFICLTGGGLLGLGKTGIHPPMIMRMDAGKVPVGNLVFESEI